VWRLRLIGYLHQVWWDPPIHNSCLAPVSFAGFLTNASAFIATWASLPPGLSPSFCSHAALLRGRFRAVWAISARGVLAPVFSPLLCHVFLWLPPSSGATWLYLAVWAISACGVPAPVFSLLIFSFFFFFEPAAR
jgi:hypothetical protein